MAYIACQTGHTHMFQLVSQAHMANDSRLCWSHAAQSALSFSLHIVCLPHYSLQVASSTKSIAASPPCLQNNAYAEHLRSAEQQRCVVLLLNAIASLMHDSTLCNSRFCMC